jgi:hypothetical protein
MNAETTILYTYFTMCIKYWWVVLLIIAISRWFIFMKANKFKWAAFIHLYGDIVEFQIVGFPPFVSVLFVIFMPILIYIYAYDLELNNISFFIFQLYFMVMVYYWIMRSLNLAALFDKSKYFGFGLILFPVIFYPILAFEQSNYL